MASELLDQERRAGGGASWTNGDYEDPLQTLFVELCVFVVLTTIAVMFEMGHHYLHHFLEHRVS